LASAAAATLLVNLPFGWLREGTRRFSLAWFLAIHAPVPLVVALRMGLGVPLAWSTLPLLVGAYFTGQALGARARRAAAGEAR
ncbi:MAG TPA: hypothetical protein VMK65_05965, partial [Longimicrobiales bacterium]|nr:hypothetical protein [Longimicrobiales bacterium]